MARDPLDLRCKTMTDLVDMTTEIGNALHVVEFRDQQLTERLLADRRQIRAEMERRRVNFDTTHNPQNYD